MKPLVSVKVITYNHVHFIKACLDSLLAQKTDFPFEIVIGEDYSTDGTREIVFDYQKKYPDKIKIIISDKNVGVLENSHRTSKACKGKYIAICDGDDYWNDPYKLQKQVSFLESHPDYGMAYSDINMVNEKNEIIETTKQYEGLKKLYKSGYIFWDLVKNCFINTLTVIVRKDVFDNLLSIVSNDKEKYWFIFDYWWWLQISKECKIKFFDERMATYRIHPNGISRNKSFYEKRSPLAKFDAITSLNNEDVATQEQKNIVGKIAGAMMYNPKIGIKNNLLAVKIFLKYPPSIPFIFSIIKKKIKKIAQ